jgi:hypothetical protein
MPQRWYSINTRPHYVIARALRAASAHGQTRERGQSRWALAFILDAMAGAQRRRFVGAALRIERVSRHAGGLLCPGVIFAKSFFVGSESSLAEHDRLCNIAVNQQHAREIATHPIRVRMLETAPLLEDRQRTLEERPRLPNGALSPQQAGVDVEAPCRCGMLGAEHLFADRKRALAKWLRPSKVTLILQKAAELVKAPAVSGCSRPNTFSRIASARSHSGRAPE